MPFPSHPVPGPGGGEAANSAPIRSRPFRGPPASDPPADRVGGTFQALSAPVQGGRALPPPQHPHSLRPCPPARRAGTGQPAPAHRVSANRSRAAGAKGCSRRCLGAAALPDPRCHAPAGCPGRCVSAGEGTCAGAEDEGARARAPAHRPALPSPRPARSPRPRGTRLRRRRSSSCSWSSDRGGGGCARGASAQIGGGGGGGGSSGTAAAPAAMSCAEVMYHPQPYGAPQCLPNPVAAATCPTACYHPSPQPGQQKKLAVYSKMQDSLEVTLPSKQEEEEEDEDEEEEEEKDQPAEMEYLNSRCVLFTYFQGDIGSVVDEHFSRALGQASTLHPESAITKSKMGLTPLWRDSSALASQRSSFPTSFWTSSYQPPAPCLGGVHPDFQVTAPPGTFTAADPSPWPGHSLHQTGPAPPPPVSESWHYPLASQVSPSYSHMHDVYLRHHHPHAHMHHRHHHHHHHHHHPSAGSALDSSYRPLLMPSVRAARISAPQCDITKTDPTTVSTATSAWAGAFHGTVDIVPSVGFDAGLQHQDKSKESPWY